MDPVLNIQTSCRLSKRARVLGEDMHPCALVQSVTMSVYITAGLNVNIFLTKKRLLGARLDLK